MKGLNIDEMVIGFALEANYEMLHALKENGYNLNINDYEPLRICAQNNKLDCAILLYDDNINVEDYQFSSAYKNLKEIKIKFFNHNNI